MQLVRLCHAVLAILIYANTAKGEPPPDLKPLPDLDYVLQRVLERAEREERNDFEFRQLYAYRRVRLKEEFGGDNELNKREELDRMHMPNPNKPPKIFAQSAPSAAASPRDTSDERETAEEMQKGRAFDRSDFPLSDELIKRFNFQLLGREIVDTRPALLIKFKPASDSLPARNLKEKFINRAAGQVWVDEQDGALVRAELRLTSPVHVLGGLVGSVYRFRCEFFRKRMQDGYWYTEDMKWRLEGRQLFARKRVTFREQKSEIQKIRHYSS